jgi:NAD(P) transhydrogenase subunit beta
MSESFDWINLGYILAAILFVFGLKMLSSASTARRGNALSALGMLIAVVLTLFAEGMQYQWIALGFVVGALIGGLAAAKVKMTGMPEMVALFNGFGGGASLLVGWAEYAANPDLNLATSIPVILAIVIGAVTFTGSLIAYGKLSETISGKPTLFPGQKVLTALLLVAVLVLAVLFAMEPSAGQTWFLAFMVIALLLGIFLTIPIGGADMPVVIALLNSYSGLAACAAGFVILNNVLIVSGALVGASGLILTSIMCKGMNRSLPNVLFGGVGAGGGGDSQVMGEPKPVSAEDAYYILEAASSVVIVPGYGMAVAQAQHTVKELAELLEENGAEVKFAIHAVAGRMPGHMNVLLAEADVPYEQLAETDDVNPIMPSVDVAVVIGANDVVNPAARDNESSPLYGMPIINVDQAKTVIVMKRSMKAGFAGVDNPLFVGDNTRMLFGDAKQSLQSLVSEFKSS